MAGESPGRLEFALYTKGYFLKTRNVTVDLCEKVPAGVALLQVSGLCACLTVSAEVFCLSGL